MIKFIQLESLTLNKFDKNNKNDLEFIKKLCNDESIRNRFQGLLMGLTNNQNNDFFNRSFLVSYKNDYIGYINIGSYNTEEKCVYLRAAIDKDARGFSYGKTLLNEVSEYIFSNFFEVENIHLKIAADNKPSLMTANACGYKWLKNDIYIRKSPYINSNNKTVNK